MAPDPRLSDKELAAINAAAVTQEYRVQPHLGGSSANFKAANSLMHIAYQIIALYLPSMGKSHQCLYVQ